MSKEAAVVGGLAVVGLATYFLTREAPEETGSAMDGLGVGGMGMDGLMAAVDPATGLPLMADAGYGGDGGYGPGGFSPAFSPEFEAAALDQGERGLAQQRSNDRTQALIGAGILGAVAAPPVVKGVRALSRAARGRQAASVGRGAAFRPSGPWAPQTAPGATNAAKAAATVTRTSRVSAAASKAATVARTVARSPVTRVAGRVAAPIAVAASAYGGVKTGQRALKQGYTKPQATALAASDSALRVVTLGAVTGKRVVKARNKVRGTLRRVF